MESIHVPGILGYSLEELLGSLLHKAVLKLSREIRGEPVRDFATRELLQLLFKYLCRHELGLYISRPAIR